jgi:hypothetical protein
LLMLVLFPVVELVMRRMRRDDVLDESPAG